MSDDRFRIMFIRIRDYGFEDKSKVGMMEYIWNISGQTFAEFADEAEALCDSMDFFSNKPKYPY